MRKRSMEARGDSPHDFVRKVTAPAMLVLGLLIGMGIGVLAGPYISPRSADADDRPSSPTAVSPALTASPTVSASEDAPRGNVMAVVSQVVRHYRGAADAPVTAVEFGDFQ